MASTTTNIGLTKPAGTDQALISAINGNMDIIDTKMGAVGNTSVQSQITSLSDQMANVIKFTDLQITPGSAGEYSLSGISGISSDTVLSVVVKDYNNAIADLYTYNNALYIRVHTRNDYATPVTSQVTLRIVYRGN